MAINCKMCGTDNVQGVEFCAACGSPMTEAAAKPKPRAGSVSAKTMMFGQAPQVTAPAPEAKQKEPAKTMLGISAVGGPQTAAQPAPMATPHAVAPPAAQPVARPAAKPAAKSSSRAHTVMGLPAVVDTAKAKAQAPAPAQPAPMARPQQAAKPAAKRSDEKHTVLGMPAVSSDVAETIAKAKQATAQVASTAAQATPRPRPSTEPLEPVAKPSEPRRPGPNMIETIAADAVPASVANARAADSWPDEDEPLPQKKGGGALIIVAIFAALVVLVGGGVLLYLLVFRGGGAELRPAVYPNPDGKSLTVALAFPGAPPGTTLQVQGRQVQVMGGQARFELPMDQLVLGENPVPVVYLEPGSAPENMTFPILMRHTVRDDLTGLGTQDPFFIVGFQVAPGIKLSVNGQPVQLAQNAYSHRVSLAQAMAAGPPTGDNLNHKLTFQLVDDTGQPAQGEHVVTIPVTKLQIDRPGKTAVVSFETVTCSGSTEDGAEVMVNGQPASVIARRFSSSVQLAEVGQHEVVVTARVLGKAPATRKIKVSRIDNFDQVLSEWSGDLDTKLDFPTLARDPAAQTNKKIKLSGRVVNINTEARATALLLYVGEGCPAGARCAVHVVFQGETDAGLQSLVDVYGIVRGTHDVDLRGGRKETMPAVKAEFIVKQKPTKKGKRRGKR
ncbi:MAG: hypothetical protein JRF63_04230 [Deltaproteobacteria bacterium]|nr:hypothetical protein [Deltaproteobacteria bacterium]